MNRLILKFGFFIAFITVVITACNNGGGDAKKPGQAHCVRQDSLPVKYAKGFSVDYYDGFKVITVRDIMDSMRLVEKYVVLPKGKPAPVDFSSDVLIETPLKKVVLISTTHVAEYARLNLLKEVAGVANVPLIYNEEVREKVQKQEICNLGNDELNYEKLLELHPSFVMTSGGYDGGDKMKSKLHNLHQTTVLNLDYKEQDPLAKAEWIKFIAAFYNMEFEADSIFKTIESNYLELKEKAKNTTTKPTVFCNLPFKEIWYMPCGENYTSRIIEDAGGDFLWKNSTATNGLNLNLDYEAVYNKAGDADYWVNLGFANSLEEIKNRDKKNALFKSFKTGKVYNFNKRNTPAGGFDFWESGTINPDKVLADLIYIFHPELLPGHELYYYQKLK